jgi:para-nitrobenzyl esterase
MRASSIALGLALGLAAAGSALAADAQAVRVESGLLSGTPGRDPAVTVFKAVPYAAPPTGERRWRPPAAPVAWQGVRKADAFGPICPQPSNPKGVAVDEDCLTLNVWTAGAAKGDRRPVLVWLPVFLGGYASEPQFDGEGLAKKGVVVVTVDYRAGPLGFLATPELSRESGHGASGNYGVMDQIAALQWVKKNIAAFGGDPTRVTLAGMSSQRGSSVDYVAMSPQAKGLFQRAISESQFPIPSVLDPPRQGPSPTSLKAAEADGAGYVQSRGVQSLAELRALPWQKLVQGPGSGGAAEGGGARRTFQPIVDGWVVPLHYNDPTATGASRADAAYVVGNNRDEGGVRSEAQLAAARTQGPDPRGRAEPKLTLAAYTAWAKQKFGARSDDFLKLYPASNDDEAAVQNNAIIREYARVATWLWSVQWSKGASKPVFTYWWTHAGPSENGQGAGAGHGSEIVYAFGALPAVDRPWTEQDRKVSDVMSSYWANIAKTGNPNGPGLPAWPAFDPAKPAVMELGDHMGPIPVATPEKLAFWKEVYLQQQGR